jgi:DNA-binding NarL/FixJ family response regulator
MALDLARAIEWRAGEAFGLSVLGLCRGAMGQYAQALPDLQMALTISEEIEHRQWSTFALSILGCIYLDLFALSLARQCLEQALALSKEMNSPYWIRLSSSFLASVYIHESAYQQAESTLESALDSDAPLDTRAQKIWWAARLELALAEGKHETGLRIGEQLMHAVMAVSPQPQVLWQGAPRLQMRYGEALAASGNYADAETHLQTALQSAQTQAAAALQWRIHQALNRLYRSQRRFEAAENEVIAAQTIIEMLAANVPDDSMRQNFLRQAMADQVPRPPSARRAAKRAFNGLTAREQQVAVLVGQGGSNSEIAAALVLSERTIEKHISNIFNKLGFNRRAQIVAWIAEKGLPKDQSSE